MEERVAKVLEKQAPLTQPMILWRGHVGGPDVIQAHTWFSTSESRTSAKNMFTNNVSGCCLFKIHAMPGIRVLNVRRVLRTSPATRKSPRGTKSPTRSNRKNNTLKEVLGEEREWIVEGGGVFYKDVEGTQKGFKQTGEFFETYYYPKGAKASPKRLTVADLVDLIDPEEYNFVTNSDYFNMPGIIPKGSSASPATKEAAFKDIQARVEK